MTNLTLADGIWYSTSVYGWWRNWIFIVRQYLQGLLSPRSHPPRMPKTEPPCSPPPPLSLSAAHETYHASLHLEYCEITMSPPTLPPPAGPRAKLSCRRQLDHFMTTLWKYIQDMTHPGASAGCRVFCRIPSTTPGSHSEGEGVLG